MQQNLPSELPSCRVLVSLRNNFGHDELFDLFDHAHRRNYWEHNSIDWGMNQPTEWRLSIVGVFDRLAQLFRHRGYRLPKNFTEANRTRLLHVMGAFRSSMFFDLS